MWVLLLLPFALCQPLLTSYVDHNLLKGFDFRFGTYADLLFNLTYNETKQYTPPYPIPVTTYSVGDHLEVQSTPGALFTNTLMTYLSFQEYLSGYADYHYMRDFIPGCCGLIEEDISVQVNLILTADLQVLFYVTRSISFYTIYTWPTTLIGDQLSIPFLNSIKNLPVTCDGDNATLCSQWLDDWGTHFTSETQIGVEVTYLISVNASAYYQYGFEWAQQNVILWVNFYDWIIGIRLSYDASNSYNESDVTFQHNAQFQLFINGKQISLNDLPTVNSTYLYNEMVTNPSLVRAQYKPITEWIQDPQTYKSMEAFRQAALQKPKLTRVNRTRQTRSLSEESSKLFSKKEEIAALPTIIPGADFQHRGFHGDTMTSSGLPVLKSTYLERQTWMYPLDHSVTFLVPDQMVALDTDEGCEMNGTSVYFTENDLIQTSWSHTSSSSFLGFATQTTDMESFQQECYVYNNTLLFSYGCNGIYQLASKNVFISESEIHPKWKQLVDALPATFDSNPNSASYQAYMTFLNQTGTHYVYKTYEGGTWKQVQWFESCFTEQMGYSWVVQQSSYSFAGIIKGGSGSAGGTEYDDETWDAWSQVSIQLQGGNGLLFAPQNMSDWYNTLIQNPYFVNYYVYDISVAIVWDTTKQMSMKQAITVFLNNSNNAYLESDSYWKKQPKIPPNAPSWCTK